MGAEITTMFTAIMRTGKMTITVVCDACDRELHHIRRGNQPAFEARLPCRISDCSRRPAAPATLEEQMALSSMDRDALRHLQEIRQAA